MFKFIWRYHIKTGIPLSAFLHTLIQFIDQAHTWKHFYYFPVHFLLGATLGSLILFPAYTMQSYLFLLLHKLNLHHLGLISICGIFQASLVFIWSLVVGIQPSLIGRLYLTPAMIIAGFVAGASVAAYTRSHLIKSTKILIGNPS